MKTGELDPDDEDDDVPLEVAVVVDGPVAVEADVPGEHPRGGDQRGVDGDLPETVPVDRRAHDYAGTPATERTASTTRSCCSRSMPPHIGSARFSAAARSVSGSEPCPYAEVAHRGLQVERRHVVRGAGDPGLARAPRAIRSRSGERTTYMW